jgi:hypothetical protein
MDINRNAPSVVLHRHGLARMDDHVNIVAIPGERLINTVVDELLDHVVESRTVFRISYVHARTLADRVEAT